MSTQPIVGPAAGNPSGALAAGERVQQLQALIAQVRTGIPPTLAPPTPASPAIASPTVAASPTSSFAATLDAAQASATTSSASTAATAYEPLIAQAAAQYGLDPAVLHGLIEQESGFDPAARSSAGALGLTQLMPGTAASLGVTEPLDPAQSIAGGARYLSEQLQRFGGNIADALAAYNAGPGAVQSYGGVPPYPETQAYVSKVLGYAAAYRQAAPSPAATQVTAPGTATAQTMIPSTTSAGAIA
jgi:soluble lytic murein transglycosylase-like protein